jgi:hypothetical protein
VAGRPSWDSTCSTITALRAKTETVEADVNRRFRTMMTMAARTRAGQPEGYYTPILLAREARGVTGEGMWKRRRVSVILMTYTERDSFLFTIEGFLRHRVGR